MGRFNDRCAIVTGGGSGIGRATAVRLAREGAHVLIVDVDAARAEDVVKDIETAGGVASAMASDVSQPESVTAMVATAARLFGDVRILVNGAGILRRTEAHLISPAEWVTVLAANLTTAFLCASSVYASMVRTRHGSIVNVASMAGRATSTLGGAHYTAAKAGVLGLTRHLAREWSGKGITVNAVSPGIVDTPMVASVTSSEELAGIVQAIPTHRLGQPDEIAALICFLISDEARYITGANVDIHGGELIIS